MLATLIAGLAMGTNVAANARQPRIAEQDAQIIVEVDRDNETLTKEGISNTQNIVMNNIRRQVTSNFSVISTYSEVANAFAISVNSDNIENIKKVPGVKSVTVNKIHWETKTESVALGSGDADEDEYGGSENMSATTMEKPDNTNDGEGTTIAILDNEFYLRGIRTEGNEVIPAWNHETYSELDSSVALKHKAHPDGWKNTFAYKSAKARGEILAEDADMGKEGSLYFNNKVPFYYDYGGEKQNYGGTYKDDLDVSSELSYHGSHVASIASGNADSYKGIAPKAQLICMKVFTNYKASGVDKQLGLSSSTGAYDIPIMNALEDCIKLNVDGINMSLGSNLNDFDKDTITVKTLNKLAASGIMTSISAGNSGKTSYASTGAYSNWTSDMAETGILSGYSNDPLSMTIAAGQPDKIFYSAAFRLDNEDKTIVAYDDQVVNREYADTEYAVERKMEDLLDLYPQYGGNLPWVYVDGFGSSSDYPSSDYASGKIAVVNRGSTSFYDKYMTAKSNGAIGLIIINNDPTSNDFNFRMSFGDGVSPSIPISIVLFKDRDIFKNAKSGNIGIVKKELLDNDYARTMSSFSSDGATYDLDLKPEITAPGENIRGAIPPQKKEDREDPERKYKIYEYLSGTSMSAPNFAGAQSVILSKVASDVYKKANPTSADKKTVENFRKTVNMRLMSTAVPMEEKLNEERLAKLESGISLASPRKQGAGMANIGGAYNTEVYLEGLDLQGNPTGKSKIVLKNSDDINLGKVSLNFLAHNEGSVNHTYSVKLTIMRPAIANNNDIISSQYKDMGSIDDISGLPGMTYFVPSAVEGNPPIEKHSEGSFAPNDVYKISRDIEYFANAAQARGEEQATTIKAGNYYNAGTDKQADWKPLPDKQYQSVYDKVIATVDLADIVVKPGQNNIKLATQEISAEAKKEIADFYKYGCYLEGYVSLTSKDGQPNLSMPYMGFYTGSADRSFKDTPVAEPFAFDKNASTVYPSDLVNNIASSLLGKGKADMGSIWLAGYLKEGQSIDTETILANDDNIRNLTGFYELGTDPNSGEFLPDGRNNLYVGNSYYSNVMVVQRFMLRSVTDNYYTIVEKSSGKTVYKSALEDMLFGKGDWGLYPLYKSHIDDSYLGAGYVAHRAFGIIPLYDRETGKPFASGDYEITFNYLLASSNEWVDEKYTLHVDSDSPEVSSLTDSGDKIRINIRENNLVGLTVDKYSVNMDEVKGSGNDRYYELDKEVLEGYLEDNFNKSQGSGRLFIRLRDAAHGEMGVIVRFAYDDDDNILYNKYTLVEHYSLTRSNDFQDDGENIQVVNYNNITGVETPVVLDGYVLVSRGAVAYTVTTAGCGGNISTTSAIISILSLISIAGVAISLYRRKRLGGKN